MRVSRRSAGTETRPAAARPVIPRPSARVAPRSAAVLLPLRAAGLALALALAASPSVRAQQIVHVGATASTRLEEVAEIVEPWGDAATDFYDATPRDLQVRLATRAEDARRTTVHLLLFGPWGGHLFSYDELAVTRDGPRTTALRTDRIACDVDGDGQNEIVLAERTVETELALDEDGSELPDSGPFLSGYRIELRYLDRRDGSLVEDTLPTDPEEPRFQALLAQPLPDALRTVLQQGAGDGDFTAHRFDKAAYRYRTVREWAERALPGGDAAKLAPGRPVTEADPDDPVVLWLSATRREAALPPAFQRR